MPCFLCSNEEDVIIETPNKKLSQEIEEVFQIKLDKLCIHCYTVSLSLCKLLNIKKLHGRSCSICMAKDTINFPLLYKQFLPNTKTFEVVTESSKFCCPCLVNIKETNKIQKLYEQKRDSVHKEIVLRPLKVVLQRLDLKFVKEEKVSSDEEPSTSNAKIAKSSIQFKTFNICIPLDEQINVPIKLEDSKADIKPLVGLVIKKEEVVENLKVDAEVSHPNDTDNDIVNKTDSSFSDQSEVTGSTVIEMSMVRDTSDADRVTTGAEVTTNGKAPENNTSEINTEMEVGEEVSENLQIENDNTEIDILQTRQDSLTINSSKKRKRDTENSLNTMNDSDVSDLKKLKPNNEEDELQTQSDNITSDIVQVEQDELNSNEENKFDSKESSDNEQINDSILTAILQMDQDESNIDVNEDSICNTEESNQETLLQQLQSDSSNEQGNLQKNDNILSTDADKIEQNEDISNNVQETVEKNDNIVTDPVVIEQSEDIDNEQENLQKNDKIVTDPVQNEQPENSVNEQDNLQKNDNILTDLVQIEQPEFIINQNESKCYPEHNIIKINSSAGPVLTT